MACRPRRDAVASRGRRPDSRTEVRIMGKGNNSQKKEKKKPKKGAKAAPVKSPPPKK